MSGVLINPYTFSPAGGGGPTEYGIETLGSLSGPIDNKTQYGWEFTVGASDITATGMRIYTPASSDAHTVRLWRVSDEVLLASVDITSSADAWVEEAFASSVVLASGTNYVVTKGTAVGANAEHYYKTSTTGFSFNSAISHVQARYTTTAGDTFPSSTTGGVYGIADLAFTT